MLTAAATSATRRATQNESSWIVPSVTLSAMSSIAAFANRTSTKPSASVNGRRSAAIRGGRIAFRTATTSATSRAPQKPSTSAPGTM